MAGMLIAVEGTEKLLVPPKCGLWLFLFPSPSYKMKSVNGRHITETANGERDENSCFVTRGKNEALQPQTNCI